MSTPILNLFHQDTVNQLYLDYGEWAFLCSFAEGDTDYSQADNTDNIEKTEDKVKIVALPEMMVRQYFKKTLIDPLRKPFILRHKVLVPKPNMFILYKDTIYNVLSVDTLSQYVYLLDTSAQNNETEDE